jgi:hypothetical protein
MEFSLGGSPAQSECVVEDAVLSHRTRVGGIEVGVIRTTSWGVVLHRDAFGVLPTVWIGI